MALGGGTWTTQNKRIPGTYINFTSLARASAALSDRGVAAAPFLLSWGAENTVFEVTAEDFRKNSKKQFGYDYDAPELTALREIFCHAVRVYCYRLGSGVKASSNKYGTAKYAGARGNAITVKVSANVDRTGYFDVETYLDGIRVDSQTVNDAADVKDNDFVCFRIENSLQTDAGSPFTGGADCTEITGEHYQAFLNAIEGYSYNALCCPTSDKTTVGLFINFTKRMRDEVGAKFQLVCIKPENADYEGVVGVWNDVKNANASASLVYWVTGAEAAVSVNKTLTNAAYSGELAIDTSHTQAELEAAIAAGKFMLHNVDGTVRVLEDINTLHTVTDEKGEIFRNNQTVRVCDQIANDVAVLFDTRYIGNVPNDASGRAALWNDVVKLIRELEAIRAIENFDTDTVSVTPGESHGSVALTIDGLKIVNMMSQLYMSVIIQ